MRYASDLQLRHCHHVRYAPDLQECHLSKVPSNYETATVFSLMLCLDEEFLEFISFHFKKHDFISFVNELLCLE